MKMRLENVPKLELHLHLDGSVRVKTMAKLVGITEEEAYLKMVCDQNTHSLTDYLKKFELPIQILQTKENLKQITKEVLEDLKKEHVIYAEIRFAPQLHTKLGLTQTEVVEAVLEAKKEVNIDCNFILCCMRHDILEQNKNNLETIMVAKKFYQKGVVALDLAGDESKYPTNQFESLFLKMQQLGIPYTIHAGEAADYHSVEEAVRFGAKRIGHGIRSIESTHVLEQLKEKQIILEICPQSNVDTCAVKSKKDHPIKQLMDKVLVTINNDNRTVSNMTLTKEYEELITECGFTIEDIKKCNLNAIEAAFISEKQKEKLRKQIEEGFYDTTY